LKSTRARHPGQLEKRQQLNDVWLDSTAGRPAIVVQGIGRVKAGAKTKHLKMIHQGTKIIGDL